MTSILDSEAHLLKRTEEVGLSERGRQSLQDAGYITLGRLAFGVGQPGVPVPEQVATQRADETLFFLSLKRS